MLRFATEQLIAWKDSPQRKPLIVRGARQVGKTWLAREFGRTHYPHCVYANFDLDANPQTGARLHDLFEGNLEPKRIVKALEVLLGTEIDPHTTLLILDEVQEQPRALSSLKYFNEFAPEYQIIAAGSHLGVTLHQNTSIPVGKVSFLYLHPMSFSEFLCALDKRRMVGLLREHDWETLALLHQELTDLLRQYYCVGGMPEVVADYSQRQSLANTRGLQRDILELFRVDFSKHAPPNQLARIWQAWDSIPVHLSRENKKFVWGAVRPGSRAKDFELALQWLLDYALAYRVFRITKPSLPLASYAEQGIFKLFLLDVGLLGAMAGLDVNAILEPTRVFTEFKGALTEQYVHQQLVAHTAGGHYGGRPYYWAGKVAEVDFVMQFDDRVVPIEVKAAENLRSQSLRSYVERFKPSLAVRASLSPYREEATLTNIPLYAIEQLPTLASRGGDE